MGRQEGIIRLTGRVGNLSFYKSQDGYMARKKSGVSRERIMTDRAYVRTRENIAEFGRGARATKLFRKAFGSLILTAADNRMTSRLTSVVMKVIKGDAINSRGKRNVTDGDVALLTDFEFNKHAGLEKAFGAPYTSSIDRATGIMTVDIPAFKPANLISAPEGATHFRLSAVGASIDFDGKTCSVATSSTADLEISDEMQETLQLSPTVAAGSVNPLFLVLAVEFLQLANGKQCSLTNGMFNAMAIVRVDGYRRSEHKAKEEATQKTNSTGSRSRDYSRATLISEAQRIALPSTADKLLQLLHERSVRRSPIIDLLSQKIHRRHDLFVDSDLIAGILPANQYPLNDAAVHGDDLYPRLDDLLTTFKPRDG